MSAPVTERLALRELGPQDAGAFAAFFASPHSAFYGGPVSADESWRRLAMYAGHRALRGWGPWAVTLRETGETVGMAGPYYPEGWPAPEITYLLVPGHTGQGYATEAVRACIDWAWRAGWDEVVSAVEAANAPSVRLAKRLGGVADGEALVPPDRRLTIYRYPRPAAESAA